MTNDSTNDATDVSTLTTNRRRFLQSAGVSAAGLAAFGGLTSAQQSEDNHIELEAVTVETGGGRGRSEYAWEDGEGGVVRGPPEEVCNIAGGAHVWVGVSPDSIADLTNPTLKLTAGETYTVEWTNTDGEEHNFVVADANGTELISSETVSEEGATQSVEFEATEEMATYYCGPHSESQSGDIEIEGGDGGDDEWIQLFDGESLDGWTPKFSGRPVGENYKDTFTVEDGVLRVDYDGYDEWDSTFGHLFYEEEFSHYMLRAEYRFVGDQVSSAPDWAFRNNGLMLHGQTPEEMDVDQDYPDSIEVQLLGQSADSDTERATANVCTPGTNIVMDGSLHEQHCTRSESDTYRGDQWVTVTVVVRGNEAIRHIVEDEGVVMSYSEPQLNDGTPLTGGTISIQSESHPTEFRTIELKPIDPEAPIEAVEPSSPLWSSYTKDELASGLEQPMAIEVTPDHRVFFTTRGPPVDGDGNTATTEVGVVDPETMETTTALELDVYTSGEDGLQGLTLDPDFEENGWIYLYYSAPHGIIDEEPHKRLSRFTVEGNTIDPESEVELLRVPSVDNPCCHVGGDLEFGPEGNLWLSVGDDTSPFATLYSPMDERDGRELYDAQRSASNTNDLRGSILRITPTDDGGYEIPDDNMFTGPEYADARENDLVREEIYVMGCRNPFRMDIDEDGVLYWGDYGPDAREWADDQGPPGMVEFNRAEEPGYYGWPYVVGPNIPYVDGEFVDADNDQGWTFESSGDPFDPQNLRNTSPNNTGLTDLPEPEDPTIWYPYSWDALLGSPPAYAEEYLPDEPPFPDFEGGAPMGLPVYEHQDSHGENALPERFFDGKQIIGEWGQQWIRYVSYDEEGDVEEINEFMPDTDFLSPMDMTVGPDGTLYLLEWGDGYAGDPISENSGIYRIQREIGVDFENVGSELVTGPGTTTTVNATVTNPFGSAIENGEVTLSAPDDSAIEVTAVEGQTFDSLGSYQSQSMSWDVTVPDGASDSHELTAAVSYTGTDGEQSRTTPAFTITVGQSIAGDWQFQTGDDDAWSDPSFDDSGWETVELPDHWEDHSNYTDDEVFGWYRKTVTVPESWEGQDITLRVGKIDDVDETFFNGTKVGQTGTFPENGYETAWDASREYTVSSETVDYGGENVIAIRVYDGASGGGLYEGPLLMIPSSDGSGGGDDGDQTLQDGLEVHLPLDGDTPTNEITGTDATIEGDVTTGQSGVLGSAYEFDVNQETGVEIPPSEATAGDGVITEPLPINGDGATAAAWINYTDHEQWGRAPFQIGGSLEDAPADGWNVQFESNTDTIRPELWDGGTPSNGSGGTPIPVESGTWYFVVVVVEGGTSRLHVFDQEGELDASPQVWTGGSRSQAESAPLCIGVGQGYDMAGRVDDVWAHSRALSADKVSELHSLSLEGSGSRALDPSTTIRLDGQISSWVGQAPSSIDGTSNPTLTLQAGETYTVEWTNVDGIGHNFEILDHDQPEYSGHIVNDISTSLMSNQGETQTVEFTATEEMARYQCRPHRSSMHGDIEVIGSSQ
ncbi:family 16 glycoside hydrolase [Halomicrobium urmianum]|uniref:family 16 glycoside hydrolase n=1 Tax=Halomicrobium urmianum TaxID=1586233 RepID=UPI001CD9E6FF|nr:family 16 glycoside hydrolase [Halomicrobium urmianum]